MITGETSGEKPSTVPQRNFLVRCGDGLKTEHGMRI
jgi:hypothetical protein